MMNFQEMFKKVLEKYKIDKAVDIIKSLFQKMRGDVCIKAIKKHAMLGVLMMISLEVMKMFGLAGMLPFSFILLPVLAIIIGSIGDYYLKHFLGMRVCR